MMISQTIIQPIASTTNIKSVRDKLSREKRPKGWENMVKVVSRIKDSWLEVLKIESRRFKKVPTNKSYPPAVLNQKAKKAKNQRYLYFLVIVQDRWTMLVYKAIIYFCLKFKALRRRIYYSTKLILYETPKLQVQSSNTKSSSKTKLQRIYTFDIWTWFELWILDFELYNLNFLTYLLELILFNRFFL